MVPAMIGVESVSMCSGLLLLSLGLELLPFGPVPFCTSTGISPGMDMSSSECQAAAMRAKTNTDCLDRLPCWFFVDQATAQQHADQPATKQIEYEYTQAVSHCRPSSIQRNVDLGRQAYLRV